MDKTEARMATFPRKFLARTQKPMSVCVCVTAKICNTTAATPAVTQLLHLQSHNCYTCSNTTATPAVTQLLYL